MTLLGMSLLGLLGALVGGFLFSMIHRLREHERLIVMRTGRHVGTHGPGVAFTIPLIDKLYRVDLREKLLVFPAQPVTTRDKTSLEFDLLINYRVIDAKLSVSRVLDVSKVLNAAAPTILRSVIKDMDQDMLSTSRDNLHEQLRLLLDKAAIPWGMTVITATIRERR